MPCLRLLSRILCRTVAPNGLSQPDGQGSWSASVCQPHQRGVVVLVKNDSIKATPSGAKAHIRLLKT